MPLDTVALVAAAAGQYSLAGMLEFNSKVQHNPNYWYFGKVG